MRLFLKKVLLFLGYIFHHNHDSKIIYYHDVSKKYTAMGTEYALIQKHFELVMRNGYVFVEQINKPTRQIMVCFDDGWAGIYDYKDWFIEKHIFPTIFIAVDLIGKAGYLNECQITDLKNSGFRFMAHTWSHQDLTTFNNEGLKHELLDSKIKLELLFGETFDALCFPMGRFSKEVKEKSQEFGYNQLFSSLPGGYYDLSEQKLICRNCMQNASPLEFKWQISFV